MSWGFSGVKMDRTNNPITTPYLRHLLSDLDGRRQTVGIRFRILGEMWKPNFMRLVRLTDRGAIFMDESTQEFVFVPELMDIVQVEVEDRLLDLEPHFHYEVTPKR
jgi:hypothetical protein